MNSRHRSRGRALLRVTARVPGCLALISGLLLYGAGSAPAAAPRMRPAPPSDTATVHEPAGAAGAERDTAERAESARDAAELDDSAVLVTGVAPGDAEVAASANGEFAVSVTNTGTRTATAVRILLNDAVDGNAVGSADGRCLGRIDASSPADLWCEVGAVPPMSSVVVEVHAYMRHCVNSGADADQTAAQDPAAAFTWRASYTDAGRQESVNSPAPTWSCLPSGAEQAVATASDQRRVDMPEARRHS